MGLGAAGLLVAGALGFGAMKLMGGSVRLDSIEPQRLRVGQRATLSGSGFSSDPAGQTVIFGEREAKVLRPRRSGSRSRFRSCSAGAESRAPVVVRTKGRSTAVVEVTVFQGPRLHGISPGAAMPGEEVLLAGAGWGVGATVKFGSATAQTLEVQPRKIRALVPRRSAAPATSSAVVVTIAGVDSNPAPFILGHLPVVRPASSRRASPLGDAVSVSGRGFETIPARNEVRGAAGVPALVSRCRTLAAGRRPASRSGRARASSRCESRPRPTSARPSSRSSRRQTPSNSVHRRAVHSRRRPRARAARDRLGPAFVLTASGGRTAAERAATAAERLNAAAEPLRTTAGLTLEARGLESSPVIGLVGHADPLLEVSEEDAAAYNEDWTGLRGRGGPATRARLARWWEALGRDLVLMTVRSQPPSNTAALAPEGRVLGQLFELAQRSGGAGVPRQVVDDARPPLKDGLRLLGLRVPPTVTAAAPGAATVAAAPAVAAAPTPPPLQLDGNWGGHQVEQGLRQFLSVTFRGSGGTVAYEGGITFTVPMLSVEKPRRDQVHFSVQIRGGFRHYTGQWDGETLAGNVSTDAAGKNVVGTFELRRR